LGGLPKSAAGGPNPSKEAVRIWYYKIKLAAKQAIEIDWAKK
jgi:hypothetical protein